MRYKLFGLKKKQSRFTSTIVPLGRTQGKYYKPTRKELLELKGSERISDTPHGYKKPKLADRINKKINMANEKMNDFDSVLDNLGNLGGKSKKSSANFGAGDVSIPGVLKDPWGKL